MARKSEQTKAVPAKKSAPVQTQEAAKNAEPAKTPEEKPVEIEVAPQPTSQVAESGLLKVTLSSALLAKLKAQAEEEGIGLDEYVRELLAESVTLRAFEIVERRFQVRGGNAPVQNQNRHGMGGQPGNHGNNNNNNRHNQNRGRNDRGGQNHRRGGMSQNRYQNIMDDKATFLEYVRNQERQQR